MESMVKIWIAKTIKYQKINIANNIAFSKIFAKNLSWIGQTLSIFFVKHLATLLAIRKSVLNVYSCDISETRCSQIFNYCITRWP